MIEWNGLPRQISGGGELSNPHEVETQLRAVDVRTIRRGRWKLNVHTTGEFELYDLQTDPGEFHNAIGAGGKEAVVHDLFERLLAWQRETNDTVALPSPTGG